MKIPKSLLILFLFAAAPTLSLAKSQSFEGITCSSDVAKELRGRLMADDRIVVTEAKYKDIELKLLWGDGVSGDPYFLESWRICGRVYVFLVDPKAIVRDVLSSPEPFSRTVADIANCIAELRRPRWAVIFRPDEQPTWPMQVTTAWNIDEKALVFVLLKAKSISCEKD